jgi:hypothetical protein
LTAGRCPSGGLTLRSPLSCGGRLSRSGGLPGHPFRRTCRLRSGHLSRSGSGSGLAVLRGHGGGFQTISMTALGRLRSPLFTRRRILPLSRWTVGVVRWGVGRR